ncbi:hypothetical protein RIF29_27312 [Crotalaria pallida]|uniref:AP2/ERF domain-containing protein n=1 Tax=Crotalaria pallida TaxID=3830 RepID=A0AAN9I0X3_CROPI
MANSSNTYDTSPITIISSATTTTPYHNHESCSNNNSSNKLYRGVRMRKWGKWVSEIRLPNSRNRIWLGSYDTQEKAARAFDAALYILRGSNANFNFPDTPHNMELNNNVASIIPRDQSLSPQEIQEIAAKFANDSTPKRSNQEEEEELESQRLRGGGGDSLGVLFESKITSPMCDYDEMRSMDWTFLNMLEDDDSIAVAGSDFGLYSDELLYYTQPPPPLPFEDNGDEIECGDAFSNHSILWSWDF